MEIEELIAMIEMAHTISSRQRMPFQPTEHGYSNYQDGCLAMKKALIAMLTKDGADAVPEIFPGTLLALDRVMPNSEVRGASPLAGEASSAEGATSTVVLGNGGK